MERDFIDIKLDRDLFEMEQEIMDNVLVKRHDELMEYFQTMTNEEVESLLERPFPALEASFSAWSIRRMLGME